MYEINRVWKNYQNIKQDPEVFRKISSTLLCRRSRNIPRSVIQWDTLTLVINRITSPYIWKTLKVFEKEMRSIWKINQNIWITPILLRNGVSFFYVPRCQNTSPKVRHLNINRKPPNLELKIIRKKLQNLRNNKNIITTSIEKCDFHSTISQTVRTSSPKWEILTSAKNQQISSETGK